MQIFTKQEAKQEIEKLIKKFDNLTLSQLKHYNEANTRKDFILPLFHALNWDVYNDQCSNEVIEEETTISGRIDYSFRINNLTQFLLEAKAIPVDLDKEQWAQQAIEYGWNKGIGWVILTDFECLKIFNSDWRVDRPKPNLTFTYNEYLTNFNDLWLLSRENIAKGELNAQAQKWGITSKRISVNELLATDLVDWRGILTNNLSQWNRNINSHDLDEAVQRILDRLIFIRVVEDRNIEEKNIWQAYQKWEANGRKPNNFIQALIPIFREYDRKYNSNLFAKHLCEDLDTEGTPFCRIIPQLYGEKEEGIKYRFDAINADVLGGVYEQYLGAVQRKEGSISKRKKQGIYYTPNYIVEYIVQNTLGKLLKETSGLVDREKIKILDPACGSGSFLIKAFELMDENLRKDRENSALRKTRILTENIYGVDLDEQAIEIARLNLLLKALVPDQKLPLLTKHMKVGNSLIDDPKIVKKAFKWQEEFEDVFKQKNPGFDVIVGNPPWVSLKGKHKSIEVNLREINYYVKELNANTYAPNLYEIFIWKSFSLLKENGYFSFIVPDRLCENNQFKKLREFLLKNFTLEKLMFRVKFPGVIVDTVIFVVKNSKQKNNLIEVKEYLSNRSYKVPQSLYLENDDYSFYYIPKEIFDLFRKIINNPQTLKLEKIVKSTSGCGVRTSILSKQKRNNTEVKIIKGKNIGKFSQEGSYYFEFKDDNLTGRTRDKNKLGVKEKILLRKTGIDLIATFDDTGIFPEQSLYFMFGADRLTLLAITGILNSKLMNLYYKNFAITNRNSTPQLKNIKLDKFPIVINKESKIILSTLVYKILKLNKLCKDEPINSDRWQELKDETIKLQNLIDKEVYRLYGLSLEEIKIVKTT